MVIRNGEQKVAGAITVSILVGLLMFSLGFGASQLTLSGDVRATVTKVDILDNKFDKVIGLMEKIVEQNTIIIARLEVKQ